MEMMQHWCVTPQLYLHALLGTLLRHSHSCPTAQFGTQKDAVLGGRGRGERSQVAFLTSHARNLSVVVILQLSQLNISNNKLTGPLPSSWSSLKQVRRRLLCTALAVQCMIGVIIFYWGLLDDCNLSSNKLLKALAPKLVEGIAELPTKGSRQTFLF